MLKRDPAKAEAKAEAKVDKALELLSARREFVIRTLLIERMLLTKGATSSDVSDLAREVRDLDAAYDSIRDRGFRLHDPASR